MRSTTRKENKETKSMQRALCSSLSGYQLISYSEKSREIDKKRLFFRKNVSFGEFVIIQGLSIMKQLPYYMKLALL